MWTQSKGMRGKIRESFLREYGLEEGEREREDEENIDGVRDRERKEGDELSDVRERQKERERNQMKEALLVMRMVQHDGEHLSLYTHTHLLSFFQVNLVL